jgi:hypothetical protein
MLQTVNAVGYLAANGQNSFTTTTVPFDFDARHTAVGGQCLGVDNGTSTRLSTLEADLRSTIGPTGISIFAYGTNDLYHYVNVLAFSASQAKDALYTSFNTALSMSRAYRTGRIIIPTVLQVSSSQPSAYRNSIDLFNIELPARVVAWNAQYGDIKYVDVSTSFNPNNILLSYDGVHLTGTANDTYGTEMAQQGILS